MCMRFSTRREAMRREPIVAQLAGAADESALLAEPVPLGREPEQPDVAREIVEAAAKLRQHREDRRGTRAGGDCVSRRCCGKPSQSTLENGPRPVPNWRCISASSVISSTPWSDVSQPSAAHMAAEGWVAHGPILEAFRQGRLSAAISGVGMGEVGLVEEDLDGRAVVVIGRHFGIEPQHLRAIAEPGGGVAKLRQCLGNDRGDELRVEAAGEVEAGL